MMEFDAVFSAESDGVIGFHLDLIVQKLEITFEKKLQKLKKYKT